MPILGFRRVRHHFGNPVLGVEAVPLVTAAVVRDRTLFEEDTHSRGSVPTFGRGIEFAPPMRTTSGYWLAARGTRRATRRRGADVVTFCEEHPIDAAATAD